MMVRYRGRVVASALMLLALACLQVGPVSAQDRTIDVAKGDPEMAAAMGKARASFPEFLAALDNPPPGVEGFALKVAIPYNTTGGNEHFWLNEVARKGNRFVGKINNQPNHAKHVKMGQRYEFGEADISDWMFMRNGKMVGNETMRPLLKRMPAAQAAQYKALMEKP